MAKSKGKGKEKELSTPERPSGHSTATRKTSAAKRRKNAPEHLDLATTAYTPSTSGDDDDDEPGITVKLRPDKSGLRIDAPGTPYNEISLTDSFLQGLRKGKPPKIPLRQRRRIFFFGGGLLGALIAYVLFLNTTAYHSAFLNELESRFNKFDLGFPTSGWGEISEMINMPDLIGPNARKWLENRDFKVGREAKEEGYEKTHAVMLIPGVISSGLESWGTDAETAQFFRKRLWGGGSMVQSIVTRKAEWIKAMSLDPKTGLDPPDVKVRSAQGLDAASYFITGYWIWSKIIENLAAIDYDYNDLSLQAYDWRLSYINLQRRDAYFSRIKGVIEHSLQVNGKKTVLVSHSMGGTVTLWFLKWVEAKGFGNGGSDWVEKHIDGWVNIGGCLLGVPKAMAAFMSGEMRDTVELNPAGVFLLEKLFSKAERAKLFRTWAGSASMLLKGGNAIWGDENGAPDDTDNTTASQKHMFRFNDPDPIASELNSTNKRPDLTLDESIKYLEEHTNTEWREMVKTNFSLGFERNEKQLKKNNLDHTKWSNPLEVQLPHAPSMKIYCLYGWGKPTERGYYYSQSQYAESENATEDPSESGNQPMRMSWIDSTVNLENENPVVKAGVVNGEGDGTVSLLSSGTMCVEGWNRKLYNPAGIQIVTHELKHEPLAFDPRGGPTTGDHIDVLGTTVVNQAVLQVAAGRGHLVNETIYSNIREYAKKIAWEG